MHAPNRNYLWTYTFVDELARCGLHAVVIAPGSRSTPLTMAFAQHPAIRVYSHIDERGAAFMALGLALASDAPAAVVCSSGTAAANFYPAIVEAHYAHVPLLVLTADRPHELRDSGANQTVDQVKLYGDHVLWSVDVALPEANPPDVAIRNLRTLADRAYALADGLPKGAVHLNFPFRKPLEPIAVEGEGWEVEWMGEGEGEKAYSELKTDRGIEGETIEPPRFYPPHTEIQRGVMMPTEAQVNLLAKIMREAKRGLIVCGPRTPRDWWQDDWGTGKTDIGQRLLEVRHRSKFLVLFDALSGLRYGWHAETGYSYYDTVLKAVKFPLPDVIVHLGALPTSQTLMDYLSSAKDAQRIWISENGVWADADHVTDIYFQVSPVEMCKRVSEKLRQDDEKKDEYWEYGYELGTGDLYVREFLDEYSGFFDGIILHDIVRYSPNGTKLVVANSLSVRHLDQFGGYTEDRLQVFCNRGASGIDGTISSALGVAAAEPEDPTVLITGDLAFYHDMNALLAAKRNGIKNLVIVLLNNNGGAIFNRLPINQPQFEPYFTELFTTPHGMTFEHTAAQFGWAYARADERETFRAAFAAALASGEPTIIEVVTDAQEDARRRKEIMEKVAEALKNLNRGGTEKTEKHEE
jgi:2-succinyl-5-enolpyruvyl-6-hydroxy-3-cyclohexene-1-carboxylate synthase